VAQPYGATASIDNYSCLAPAITDRFWKAVEARDLGKEREMMEKYEQPWRVGHV